MTLNSQEIPTETGHNDCLERSEQTQHYISILEAQFLCSQIMSFLLTDQLYILTLNSV